MPTTSPLDPKAASVVDGEDEDELHPKAPVVPQRTKRSTKGTSRADGDGDVGTDMDETSR
jgi:hypothetical protein